MANVKSGVAIASDLIPGVPIKVRATKYAKAYHGTVIGPGPDAVHIRVRHGTKGGEYLALVENCRLILKSKRRRKINADTAH